MDTNKKIVASILIGIIVLVGIIMIVYKDDIFKHKMTIVYPDDCVEKFENGLLVTDECVEGRLLKQQENLVLNYNILNMTR